jgi:hypothetical protein
MEEIANLGISRKKSLKEYHRQKINLESTDIVYRITKVTKIEAANGKEPEARFCHRSVLIGTDPGQKEYLVTFGGANNYMNALGSILIFDFMNRLWIPLA